jgi:hypothetical protein
MQGGFAGIGLDVGSSTVRTVFLITFAIYLTAILSWGSNLRRAKKGPPRVATGGDEVKVSRAIVAVKIPWHPDGVT